MAASTWGEQPGGAPFDHYDSYGQPVDANGNLMQGGAQDGWAGGEQTPPPFGTFRRPGETPIPAGQPFFPFSQNGVQLPPATTQGTPQQTEVTAPSTVTSAGSSGAGSAFSPWSGHFAAPTPQGLPPVPTFDESTVPNAPAFRSPKFQQAAPFSYDTFTGPTMEEAANSPGYKFRVEQGQNGLQNWAAARGTLNDSGTAKALEDYGQNAASQEYANVFKQKYDTYSANRSNAADAYRTNYQTQYIDPFVYNLQAAQAEYAPQLASWQARVQPQTQASLLGYQTQAANVQHTNDVSNTNAYNDYYLGWQDYENRRQQGVNFALGS